MWRAAWLRTRPWNEKRSKTGYFYSIAGLSQFWGQYTVKVQGAQACSVLPFPECLYYRVPVRL
jgi:hypothetical protein